jgi:hypothetical protein
MNEYDFNGEKYNDDRMFVMIVAQCNRSEDDEFIITKIYHESNLSNMEWCVVTFRNVERYRAYRVDLFSSKEEANNYLEKIEPETPLISLGGISPKNPLTFDEYREWKKNNQFKDYDYKKMFKKYHESDVKYFNPTETLYEKK